MTALTPEAEKILAILIELEDAGYIRQETDLLSGRDQDGTEWTTQLPTVTHEGRMYIAKRTLA